MATKKQDALALKKFADKFEPMMIKVKALTALSKKKTAPSTRKALRDLFKWITGPASNRAGNPYLQPPVTAATLALSRGSSRYDKPSKRPTSKVGEALYDLVDRAVGNRGNRHGNPYSMPEVRAASLALGGDGFDVP